VKIALLLILTLFAGIQKANASQEDSLQSKLYKELNVSKVIIRDSSRFPLSAVVSTMVTEFNLQGDVVSQAYNSESFGEYGAGKKSSLMIQVYESPQLKKRTNYDDDTLESEVEFVLDEKGNEIKKTVTRIGEPVKITKSWYDDKGRLIRMEFYEGKNLTERDSFSYDLPVLDFNGNRLMQQYNYHYVGMLEMIGMTPRNFSSDSLVYQFADHACYKWIQEKNGRYRLSQCFFYDKADRFLGGAGYGNMYYHIYDELGREYEAYSIGSIESAKCYTYDESGNLIHEESNLQSYDWYAITYSYNNKNQLVKKSYSDSWTVYDYYPNGLRKSTHEYKYKQSTVDFKKYRELTGVTHYTYEFFP
jgi:hypothetical protein